jgi:hypothetical protein
LFLENGQTDREVDMTKPIITFQNYFFENLLTKGFTGNTGSFHTVSDAKLTSTKITSGIFSGDKIVEVIL